MYSIIYIYIKKNNHISSCYVINTSKNTIELNCMFKKYIYTKSNILQDITGNFGEAELDGGDLLPLGQHRDEDRFRH